LENNEIKGYYISNNGLVASIKDKHTYYNPYIMSPFETSFGYLRIELKTENGPKKFFIHRLVYETWIGELKDNMVIEHLDSNPKNNYYLNLKQSTQKENIHTCIKQKRRNYAKKQVLLYNCQNNRYYIFYSVQDLNNCFHLKGDSLSKFKRSKNRMKTWKILDIQSLEGQSTIETINFVKSKSDNGVEYLIGANPVKEVYNS
jgi:hypothetical protein